MPPPRPLLFVFAHGIGAHEFDAIGGAQDDDALAPPAAIELPEHPVATVLRRLDAAAELRDLGITVDRRSLVLRPQGRSDASAIEALAHRVKGPAAVTLFESFDVLAHAAIGGLPAARRQAAQLAAAVARLRDLLRRGDRPETWFVGLGSPHAVHTTFDFARAWHERIVPPLADEVRLGLSAGSATITAANVRSLDLVAALLRRSPFAAHATAAAAGGCRLHCRARQGVAFGRHRVAARAPEAHEANAVFAAPVGDSVRNRGIPFDELIGRFWMRAATQHGDVVAPTPTRTPTESVQRAGEIAAPIDLHAPQGN